MEPSCAPELPAPDPNDVNIKKLGYTQKQSTLIEFSYKWEIPNFRNVTAKTLKSPVFSPGVNNQLKWSLILYPYGTGYGGPNTYRSGNEHVSLYLCFEHSTKPEVTATFQLSILNGLEKKRTTEMNKPWMFKHGTQQATYGYDKFVSRYDVNDYYKYLVVNEILTILCEIKVHAITDSFLGKNEGTPFKIPNGRLLDNIEFLFAKEQFTDFTIVVDAQEFPVHRAILSVRSSVFAAMFEHDTEEQKNHRVDITDMSPEVLEEMLRFIYTDKVTNIKEVAFDLLAAANKYALDRLKIMCAEALRKSLAIENAAEILILADLHDADQLKSEAIKFINEHTIPTMDTEGFKSMVTSHPYLVADTLRASAMQKEVKTVHL